MCPAIIRKSFDMTDRRSSTNKRQHSDEEDSEGDNEQGNYSDEEGGVRIDDIYIPPAPKPVCSTADDGPRTIITKIVNKWFKSYAEQQIVGPFHKRFNAIIGPNGSGKSNVIDSMLFVFGYRANRIRCKKVSTLLHNSNKFHNVHSCTVSVHFAKITDMEGDNYHIIPNSEFVVSRTANKDNSSFYELNGQRVQFKEIASLLRLHGVDLDHNRFLILQGEVEQIAMMKSKASNEHETGMLEYLEDIIGTSRYKEPLVKLSDRVEILNEQRSDKLNRLKLIETDMNQLKEPMEEAVGFLKLENNITVTRNILFQKELCELEDKKSEKDKEKESVDTEVKEFVNKLKSITENQSELEEVYNNNLKVFDGLQKKRDLLKENFNKANAKDYQVQTSMEQTNNLRKKYKQQLVTEKKKLEDLKNLPAKSANDLKELHKKQEQLTSDNQKLEEDKVKLLASLNDDTKVLRERREKLEPKLADLQATSHEAQSAFTLAESKLNIFVRNEEKERAKLENISNAINTVKETVKLHSSKIKELEPKIPLTLKSLQEATNEFDAIKVQLHQMHKTKTEQWSNLESTKSAMQASRSKSKILDSLMQQKHQGNCPGYFGRLGDLGAIDKKYDIAISTACGPLDNIVVDTVDTAQWCIEFLKQYDLGRATFIALDQQERYREAANSRIQTPENVHRLYDLVQVNDDRVRTAFYYGLRNTLVANDLNQASRVAYGAQRYRVVTLQGAMIEISGAMSGGGKTVSKGRMGQSIAVTDVQPDDLKRMELELQELEENIRQKNKQYGLLEKQIDTLRPELEKMKLELTKCTTEFESLKHQEPSLQQELKEQKHRVNTTKANPEEVNKLQKVVQEKKSSYESASKAAATFQKEVDTISNEINERMTGPIKALEKKINQANKQLTKVKDEISRINVAVKTADRSHDKCEAKIASLEEDIQNAEESIRKLHSEKEEIETDAKQLLKSTEEVTSQLAEKEEEISEQKQELGELAKAEKKLKSNKIEIDQKLETVNKAINQLNAEMHKFKQRKAALKLHRIPGETETVEELKDFTREELKKKDMNLLNNELHAQEQEHKNASPNLKVIEEFEVKQRIYLERFGQLEEVTNKRNNMRDVYESLRTRRKKEFLEGYDIIRKQLKEMYQMITLGGDADFELVDNFDPFTEGVQFNVRPPKKSWKNIRNLSGGEKTLSSLALVFALHYYKPSPLYVMDEIDAALDFKNVSIVGHYIKERTKNAQFVIISLRPNMFELADYLVGIYKTLDCTHSVTIDPRKFGTEPEAQENILNDICADHEDDDPQDDDDNNSDAESRLTEHPMNISLDQVIDDSFDQDMNTDK